MAATEPCPGVCAVAVLTATPAPIAGKRRYRVDLVAQQEQAASNYQRLLRLLPELQQRTSRELLLRERLVRFVISHPSRYTSFVTIHHDQPRPQWLAPWCMELSLYHDAGLAEVVRCMNQRAVAAVHDYPNRRMYQIDEKWQLNSFLGEWLRFCLQQGEATACELPFLPTG